MIGEPSHARDSIVTGGGSGIGRAICRRLSADGVVGDNEANGLAQRARALRLSRTPLGWAATVDDVAALAAHVTSSEASYATGSVHMVDGGLSAGYLRSR